MNHPRVDRWRLAISVLVVAGFISAIWFTVWAATNRANEARTEAAAKAAYDRCIESIPLIHAFNEYTMKVAAKTGVTAPVWPEPDRKSCEARRDRELARG